MCQPENFNEFCQNKEWLTIPYLEKYEVSCQGRIRNKKTQRIKMQTENHRGYYRVQVWIGNRTTGRKNIKFFVHRIVAATFIGWIEDMDVNHKDKCRNNNSIYNLEYLTHQENCNYEPPKEEVYAAQ